MNRRVCTPAVEFLRREVISRVEWAHAAAAPEDCIGPVEICHDAASVFDRGIVKIPDL